MFCPQAIEWGNGSDVAGVIVGAVAAGITLWAVIVALITSARAEKLAREQGDAERAETEKRESARRRQLAIALDQDFYMCFGATLFSYQKLMECQQLQNGDFARLVYHNTRPDEGLELLNRFIADFALFPDALGGNLMRVYSLLKGIQKPIAANVTDEAILANLEKIIQAHLQLMFLLRVCRIDLGAHIPLTHARSDIATLPRTPDNFPA